MAKLIGAEGLPGNVDEELFWLVCEPGGVCRQRTVRDLVEIPSIRKDENRLACEMVFVSPIELLEEGQL
jgi:hypothetical protein